MTQADRKPSLLLIEDDFDVAEMLLLYFESQGYETHHVDLGQEGISLAHEVFPNLILLDVMLPDMDGYDVCHQLRQKSLTRYIPIIFLTQKDERASKVKGLELGADDYITKPFDVDELRLRVKGAINRATRENLHEPRTGLPTGPLIQEEIEHRRMDDYSQLRLTIEGFQKYMDVYSFLAAKDVLYHTGKRLQSVLREHGTRDDFIGIYEDDFIILTCTEDVPKLQQAIEKSFEENVSAFYSFADAEKGGIVMFPDTDTEEFIPMMTLKCQVREFSN